MKEIWKDIPGYETLYQASNLGNIKSIKREHYIPSLNKIMYVNNSENIKHAYNNKLVDITKKYKKVNQYDLNGNFIKQWDSMKEAGEKLHICSQNISMCCRGLRNKTNNYVWRYANGD